MADVDDVIHTETNGKLSPVEEWADLYHSDLLLLSNSLWWQLLELEPDAAFCEFASGFCEFMSVCCSW